MRYCVVIRIQYARAWRITVKRNDISLIPYPWYSIVFVPMDLFLFFHHYLFYFYFTFFFHWMLFAHNNSRCAHRDGFHIFTATIIHSARNYCYNFYYYYYYSWPYSSIDDRIDVLNWNATFARWQNKSSSMFYDRHTGICRLRLTSNIRTPNSRSAEPILNRQF